ncbi:MAG: hypothetical protein Q4G59_12250, partial [Planctomycetia bacterium]|nr:hypothetical protein [Planctomycetia bacterium]
MRYINKSGKTITLTRRGKLLLGLGALISAAALFAPIPSLFAVAPNGAGVVTLTETDHQFPQTASYTGTQFADGLLFENDSAATTPIPFTNLGTIGTTDSPMSRVNGSAVGMFTNEGTINFSEIMSVSALTNTAGHGISSTVGNLTITNEASNSGTIDIAGTLTAKSLINN